MYPIFLMFVQLFINGAYDKFLQNNTTELAKQLSRMLPVSKLMGFERTEEKRKDWSVDEPFLPVTKAAVILSIHGWARVTKGTKSAHAR